MAIAGALAVAAVGAAASAYSAHQQGKAVKNASKGAGTVDLTTTQTPWGPSTDYRTDIMANAQNLWNTRTQRWGAGPGGSGGGRRGGGGGGGGAGGGGTSVPVTPTKPRGHGGGGGGGAGGGGNFGSRVATAAEDYTNKTLAGVDQDPYRGEAAQYYRDLPTADPNLARYLNDLFSQYEGGPGGGRVPYTVGADYATAPAGGGSSSSSGLGEGPVGAAAYIKKILDSDPASNPQLQAIIDMSTRDIREKYMNTDVPGINDRFGGASRLGSNAWAQAVAAGNQKYAQELGDTVSQLRYGDYTAGKGYQMQALGLGEQLDEAAMRENTARAASRAAGGSNAAASALQERLATLGALGDAVGMSTGLYSERAKGLGAIGSDFANSQQGALGYAGQDVATRASFQANMAQVHEAMAAARLSAETQRRGQDLDAAARSASLHASSAAARWSQQFQEFQYNQQAPWQDLARYSDLINAQSQGYGTTTETGMDRRSQSPGVAPSVWQQALAGGLGAYGMYQNYAGQGGYGTQPNYTSNPTPPAGWRPQ